MRYFPHTDEDIKSMLQTVGVEKLSDLFEMIPLECRKKEGLDLPNSLTEWNLSTHMIGND